MSKPGAYVRLVIAAFLILAAAVSWRVSQGVMISDENAYRFQARTFASGRLFSPPPPGAGERPIDAARPVRWAQEICWRAGAYSKYPVGWPAVLALPEKVNAGWLVTPVLGALLLLITGMVAHHCFGGAIVLPAVVMAALSPYVLAYSVGRMSHALAAVLIALACLACLKGIATRSLSKFIWMCAFLLCTFHVRPYTAFVASMVLGTAVLISIRNERKLLTQVLTVGAVAAAAIAGSVAIFNWTYTGHPTLSPHAFAMGTHVPPETTLNLSLIARNIVTIWRFAAQTTWLFSFPFIFPLAAYGVWTERRSAAAWILAALFCAVVVAHLTVKDSSSSVIGERFWFEAFFAVVVLGARGLVCMYARWRPTRLTAAAVRCAVGAAQLILLGAAIRKMDSASTPGREVQAAAETYKHCHCVVFLEDNPPFYAEHLNLNGPDWRTADVFYAIDPGASERPEWARRFGRTQWVVVTWDPRQRTGVTEVAN